MLPRKVECQSLYGSVKWPKN